MKSYVIGNYQYHQNHLLGEGSTGKVYAGFDKRKQKKVAIKAIELKKIDNEVLTYLLQNQKNSLLHVRSPYVLKLVDIIENNSYCYILTELYQNGSLSEYIRRKRRIQQQTAMELLLKIIKGLKAIHQEQIIHRDMKPHNIMLNGSDPIIIDFGYSQYTLGSKPLKKYNVGSPAYMAPEAYISNKYSQKSDIWSVGVIYHELLTNQLLDELVSMKQFFHSVVVRGSVRFYHDFSENSMKILAACLNVNPRKRANANELIKIVENCLKDIQSNKPFKRQLSSNKKGGSYSLIPTKDKNKYEESVTLRMESKRKNIQTQKFSVSNNKNTTNSMKSLTSPLRKIKNIQQVKPSEINPQSSSHNVYNFLNCKSKETIDNHKKYCENQNFIKYRENIQEKKNYDICPKFNMISKFFHGKSKNLQIQTAPKQVTYKKTHQRANTSDDLSFTKYSNNSQKSIHLDFGKLKNLDFLNNSEVLISQPIVHSARKAQQNSYSTGITTYQSEVRRPQLLKLRDNIKNGVRCADRRSFLPY